MYSNFQSREATCEENVAARYYLTVTGWHHTIQEMGCRVIFLDYHKYNLFCGHGIIVQLRKLTGVHIVTYKNIFYNLVYRYSITK